MLLPEAKLSSPRCNFFFMDTQKLISGKLSTFLNLYKNMHHSTQFIIYRFWVVLFLNQI